MTLWLVALAGVLVFEGLVLALAPSRVEDMLRVLIDMPVPLRRMLGLGALAAGVMLVWIAQAVG
ncbi:DUF2065 domain-containing protein [Meridianimarinicoccus sp. RP-17]|uniref:DUF2065 domain-containing protein n=1 Tax=Meridianimarinicoccus zhengii TaxID=2056810 RepID=UPI000DAD051A|nr:DUF2065 domain-containing protein [Phycocomes zhengii]